MTSARPNATRTAALTLALLSAALVAPRAFGAPMYDDGLGNGCVSCHSGFVGGNQPLHTQHRVNFGVTNCNVCHQSGGGSTPVLTYWSGSGGGRGCVGCHGHDYGETSPNSGQPKSTGYGLRQLHVNAGVTTCGSSGCHQPGALGHSSPFPAFVGENVLPTYFTSAYSTLTDPCSSIQEDLPFDVAEFLGLDNDGDGNRDYPADADCPTPTTTTTSTSTTTTTIPLVCGGSPAGGCVAPGKAVLLVNEKSPGKEKFKVVFSKLQAALTPAQFGDPVTGGTQYRVCIYDDANVLQGTYGVARAGDNCGDKPCWSVVTGKGYKYGDPSLTADGVLKMQLLGGDLGKGKIKALGKNNASTMPTGIAAALAGSTSATVHVLTSDAGCFGGTLSLVKKADGLSFSAVGP